MKLNKYIDHTILKPDTSYEDLRKLCDEAIVYNFASVCINPCNVKIVKQNLLNSDVKICTVIGFPLGANTLKVKKYEAKNAIKNGADEIDMVINIARLKNLELEYVTNEIAAIKKICKNRILKVIVETCLLSQEDKINACKCVINGGADFIKTSTGFSTAGANIADIELFKSQLNGKVKIKASGGIRTKKDALLFIEKGASRIGTSNGVQIVNKKETL